MATVDYIGIDRETDEVVLTLLDRDEWHGADDHLMNIQERINAYIAFVESGELLEKYPNANERSIRLDIRCKHPVDEVGNRFFASVKETLTTIGIALRVLGPSA